jgi:hypothetical protein
MMGTTVNVLSPSGRSCSLTTPTAKSPYGATLANTTAPDIPSHSEALTRVAGSDRGKAITENSNDPLIRLAPAAMLPRTWAAYRRVRSSRPRARS